MGCGSDGWHILAHNAVRTGRLGHLGVCLEHVAHAKAAAAMRACQDGSDSEGVVLGHVAAALGMAPKAEAHFQAAGRPDLIVALHQVDYSLLEIEQCPSDAVLLLPSYLTHAAGATGACARHASMLLKYSSRRSADWADQMVLCCSSKVTGRQPCRLPARRSAPCWRPPTSYARSTSRHWVTTRQPYPSTSALGATGAFQINIIVPCTSPRELCLGQAHMASPLPQHCEVCPSHAGQPVGAT